MVGVDVAELLESGTHCWCSTCVVSMRRMNSFMRKDGEISRSKWGELQADDDETTRR